MSTPASPDIAFDFTSKEPTGLTINDVIDAKCISFGDPPGGLGSDLGDFIRREEEIARRENQKREAVDTADDSLTEIIRRNEEGLIDPDFNLDWGRQKQTARELQKLLVEGNQEAIHKLLKEMKPEDLHSVAMLINNSLEHMQVGLSVDVDDHGRLLIMDKNTNKGIALSGDGSVSSVERSPSGEIMDNKCFDPFALSRVCDRLQSEIYTYRLISYMRPYFAK